MVEVNWTDKAFQDIENIAKFISQHSVKYSKIQLNRFFQEAKRIESNPKLGRKVPEFNQAKIRELIIGNYRIVYLIVSSQRVDILTVHHSARVLGKGSLK